MPYSVTVRDHMMVAHSFKGEMFGPAQQLHGATFVVDATFHANELTADGVVVDIGRASSVLSRITGELGYRNLDDVPELAGVNTTTEVLCQVVADRLADALAAGEFSAAGPRPGELGLAGRAAPPAITELTVTLHESHIAWASYSRRV